MSSFELDPDEMRKARSELAEHLKILQDYRGKASGFGEPIKDGHGLVAEQMRKAYLDRGDLDNGVQAVMNDYIAELTDILTTIDNTLSTYDRLDADGAAAVRRSAQALSGEMS